MRLAALVMLYHFFDAASCRCQDYQRNLIDNIINSQNMNVKIWWIVAPPLSDDDSLLLNTDILKILYRQRPKNFPSTRNFAAIVFASIDSELTMSLKLPADVIKIYLDHNGCQLNETKLDGIMSALWHSDGIGFIYYISFCSSSNYDAVDSANRDNYNCTINLFHHQPFVRRKSGQWGVLEKLSLINGRGGGRRRWVNASQPFPVRRRHSLKLNGLNMTVILFPSTNAYRKSTMEIFRNQLSRAAVDDPLHTADAYFGPDVELLEELRLQMDFNVVLSPTSDGQLYGYQVSTLSHLSC